MKQEKIEMFLMNNQKNFETSQIPLIVEKLQSVDNDTLMLISSLNYKDPTTMLIVSLFLGGLGVDRFLLGETGMGVLKLLTAGCFGVLTIIDWCTIISKTRKKNFEIFMESVNIKNYFSVKNTFPQNKNSFNNIEEIKKLKKLFDEGIITQEEFEKKKKELL